MFSLQNKVAIVTGAGQGIGKEIARILALQGAAVVIADKNEAAGCATEAEFQKEELDVAFSYVDACNSASVNAVVEAVIGRERRLDIVVHNAAVFPFVTIKDLTDEQLEQTLAVNLKACFYFTKASAPQMIKQRRGRILFTSSVTGPRVAVPLLAHYAASKAGVNGYIRSAALEYARYGITVNGVEPGFIRTPAMERFASPEEIVEIARSVPAGSLGSPRDIAYAMAFLASDEASYVNGQTIVVDGAATLPESPAQLASWYEAGGIGV
ncbi:SDR family oxidoreductase [Paraburkholderia sp. SIMBA_049]